MRYPIMNRKPERTIEIPSLSGGLNLRESANAILDNQLSDAKNVWFKDSRLKTRPGMRFNPENYTSVQATSNDISGFQVHKDIVNYKGQTLLSVWEWADYGELGAVRPYINFFWSDGTRLGYIYGNVCSNPNEEPFTYFALQFEGNIYCITSFGMYRCVERNSDAEFRKLSETDISIKDGKVNYDFYIPTVLTNGLPQVPVRLSGTKWERYNRIGRYAKVVYSTVNLDLKEGTDGNRHAMCYVLPGANDSSLIPENTQGLKIKAVITDGDGNKHIHSITLDETGWGEENKPSTDGIYMTGDCTSITFTNEEKIPIFIKSTDNQILNNLEIYFPYENTGSNEEIFKMTRAEWYGGASEGINGGTRLFLCGNTEEKDKNLVVWSGLNNPLYFPDNGYFRVGNDLQPVTAFGKQNDMLILFKPNEIYGTCYTRGDSVTVSQVIEGGASAQSSSVYFPLTLLHSKIGCNIPNSVQLCKNRLIWAHTNGNIYTLVSQNQYSERNVFPICEMLKPELSGFATSADADGMYYLLEGHKMYVIDYNSYGYSYVAGYSKDQDSNLKIPSWYFELTRSGDIFEENGKLRLLRAAKTRENDGLKTGVFIYEFYDGQADLLAHEGEDALYSETIEKGIEFSFKTKLFDFGHPELTKNINTVNFSVSAVPLDFQVKYITENFYSDNENVTIPGMIGKILNVVLKPLTKLNTHFGIEISGTGIFEGDSLKINYKTIGGAK